MSWEHAEGPLLFRDNYLHDKLNAQIGIITDQELATGREEVDRLHQLTREAFVDGSFNDRERDHYYMTGEIYENAERTRREYFGL